MQTLSTQTFDVAVADYHIDLEDLRAVRETVFVQEQQVPLELEWDALDPECIHVIARDAEKRPIGTGRLVPASTHAAARIGRMAVLPAWRGQGVGDAILNTLIAQARQHHWLVIHLHAQVSAIAFYQRHGFIPDGPRFMEAGIEHQTMHRRLDGPMAIETHASALAITIGIIHNTRRELSISSRQLDPGLFDDPGAVDAIRKLATRHQPIVIRILLQDAGPPQRTHAPLIELAQRLPSVFAFREVADPVDRNDPSAFIANDNSGIYIRPLGHRFDGEASLDNGGRSRQVLASFQPVWERSRPCTEYRALQF